jgi:DNA-binding response OmpR family regulator
VLELVVAERRRRAAMRAVHLAPPEAVEARLAALEAGFDDALTTATPATELAGRLAWLDARARPKAGTGTVLQVADGLELDLTAHELRRDGRIVHLRPKEFGLLALLAAHPGRAYTRRELLSRVWGVDHSGGQRTVDVHVRWLRSKIEPEPGRPVHLVTVRGLGYRLDPQR